MFTSLNHARLVELKYSAAILGAGLLWLAFYLINQVWVGVSAAMVLIAVGLLAITGAGLCIMALSAAAESRRRFALQPGIPADGSRPAGEPRR